MFFSFPKLGIKCLLSLSKGGIKYIWRYLLEKTCAKSIVITTWIFATTKKVERMLYNKKKNSPRIFTTASS